MIELLVVMAAMGVLLAIVAPRYAEHADRSREVVLKHNLVGLRGAIDRFHSDHARYPKDLQELVQQRYLREIPLDPVTDRADTWVAVPASGAGQSGLFDVRSGAPGQSRSGGTYASW